MDITTEIKEEEHFLKNVFNRFRKKDFSGTTGQAMKNSSYQLAQNLIFKIGSLIFTIIVARLLLPDRMGLYNLSLATIVLFSSFSDFGVGHAIVTYGAKMLGRGDLKKCKGYAKTLFRWKLYLIFIASGILLLCSYFISEFYYQKPIFYALLVGAIYIPITGLIGFIENMFRTTENFRTLMNKEIILQISRFIIVPLAIVLFLGSGISNTGMVVITLIAIAISYSIALSYLVYNAKKKISFLKVDSENLNDKEINDLKKFIYPLSVMAMTGLFFGYIDTLMLGRYVSESFIAYYGAAFSLVGGATAIIGFMALSLMPIFAKKEGRALESIFKKTRNLTFLISSLTAIFTYFVAWFVVRIAYGVEYLPATPVLKIFSFMILLTPVISLYVTYFITQKKTKEIASLLVVSTILNIIFNYFAITFGITHYGEMGGVYGACIATILSRVIYLAGLVVFRKR